MHQCHLGIDEVFRESIHFTGERTEEHPLPMCNDCHGQHNVFPKADTRSTLSHENIIGTCGQCHKGSHRQFTGYLTHATHHDKDKFPVVHYTWLAMTALLVGTFVFFGIHTLLWLPRSFQAIKHSRQLRKLAKGEKQFRRFGRLERSLHVMVIVSFLTLAVTGMTLKFSYQPWAQWLSGALGGFQSTGTLHRMAAILTDYRHRFSGIAQ